MVIDVRMGDKVRVSRAKVELEVKDVRPGMNGKQVNIGIKEIKTQVTSESGSQVLNRYRRTEETQTT